MKSPFRKMRQTLFNEGKLVRYIGYAVGEIALIIIGIMVALELNNWNEDKKAQAEFELYIVQLKEDVRTAILEMDRRLVNEKQRIPDKLMVLTIIEDKGVHLEDIESFEGGLRRIGTVTDYEVYVGFLGDLLNGKLGGIVQNRNLVRQVQTMSKELKRHLRIIEEQIRIIHLADETLIKYRAIAPRSHPELKKRYDLETLRTSPEFLIALENAVAADLIRVDNADNIKETLSDFLAVLEEY